MPEHDDEIRTQLHAAFDELIMSDEASERILSELMAHEQATSAELAAAKHGAPAAVRRASRIPFVVLPVAAALVLALIVGHNSGLTHALKDSASYEAAEQVADVASEDALDEQADVYEADAGVSLATQESRAEAAEEAGLDADIDAGDAELSAEALDHSSTDIAVSSFVTSDGSEFVLVLEGGAPVELASSAASELLGSGTAPSGEFRVYSPSSTSNLVEGSYVVEVGGVYLLAQKL